MISAQTDCLDRCDLEIVSAKEQEPVVPAPPAARQLACK